MTSGTGRPVSVAACTIAARNYLAAAGVLSSSYLAHHPGHVVVVLVVDATADELAATPTDPGVAVLSPEALDLDTDTFLRMATAYDVTELATALKPSLLQLLRRDHEVVVYLDPDIEVLADLHEVVELARQHSLVLTPHNLAPIPRDGLEPAETAIMGSGMFNLGFVAVGPGSEAFLAFWAERLRHDAVVAPDRQLFTDQRWVDWVPSLFTHHVSRDPGLNVAYWNAWERELSRAADGTVLAGSRPLRFFHYSGYGVERPWLLSRHAGVRPRVLLSEHPVIAELCAGYAEALRRGGRGRAAAAYRFATTPGGEPITTWMRRAYGEAWRAAATDLHPTGLAARATGDELPPPPFGPQGEQPFLAWLSRADNARQRAAGLNRMHLAVWRTRIDLQAAFPDPTGDDAKAFGQWCRRHGVLEGAVPPWAAPTRPARVLEPVRELGVNLVGYLTGELGNGEQARVVHDALVAAGLRVASVVEDALLESRTAVAPPTTEGRPVFPVTVMVVNADQTVAMLDAHPDAGHRRYVIGLWAWELDDLPPSMHEAFALVDEIWTVSDFCRDAIARHTSLPVHTVPIPVRELDPLPATGHGGCRFLFAFDYLSIAERKNPWGLVEAFHRAFGRPGRPGGGPVTRSDAQLTIKTINAELRPVQAERLRAACAGDPRITLVEKYVTADELDALYAESDCYVSLHRSEGFGLTIAEAMARGLPTITTGYSGSTEFTTTWTGWSVGHEMVAVGPGCDPYPPTARWADPDLDQAAAAMRAVADDPEEARRRGRAGREHVRATRDTATAAAWMRTRVGAAFAQWSVRTHPADETPRSPGSDGADGGPPAAVRHELAWGPADHPLTAATTPTAPLETAVPPRRGQRLAGQVTGWRRTLGERRRTTGRGPAPAASAPVVDGMADRVADLQRTLDTLVAVSERALAPVVAPAVDDTTGAAVPVLCDAGVLLFPADDAVVRPWVEHYRSWEPEEAQLMHRLLMERGGGFVDVGAHVGYHSVRLAQRLPGLRVVAVEPAPGTVELLLANTHGLADVAVLPVAAWDADGHVALCPGDPQNSGDVRVGPAPADGANGVTQVPAVRLDGAAEVRSMRVGLVKTDLEGRDHRALAGLRNVLARDLPDVVTEFAPAAIRELGDDPAAVLAGYRALGYPPYALDGTPWATDAELLARAGSSPSGFVSLWLRPDRPTAPAR